MPKSEIQRRTGRALLRSVLTLALTAGVVFFLCPGVALAEDDGTYTPSFGYTGGTGRVTITCPEVTVENGETTAELDFDSPYYDYVKIGEDYYYSESEAGEDSSFTIPVTLNGETEIAADTTAMSEPHEIEYTLYIYTDGTDVSDIQPENTADASTATQDESADSSAVDENSWGAFGSDQTDSNAVSENSEETAASAADTQSDSDAQEQENTNSVNPGLIAVAVIIAAVVVIAVVVLLKRKNRK